MTQSKDRLQRKLREVQPLSNIQKIEAASELKESTDKYRKTHDALIQIKRQYDAVQKKLK